MGKLNAFMEGSQIYLRPLKLSDVNQNYLTWLSDPEVMNGIATSNYDITSLEAYVKDKINDSNVHFLAIIFKENDTATLIVNFLNYKEEEEIKWSIVDNEIAIDDSLNKRINIGSENNRWVLEDDIIVLKEKNQNLYKNIFLRKVLQ